MKKYILGTLFVALLIGACTNPNKKEINEVDALLVSVIEVEQSLLSIDTAKVFGTKRQLEKDLAAFNKIGDTLSREDAFEIADYFGSKKKLYRLTAGYSALVNQIRISKEQLNNLKQDLENGLIDKEDYATYYSEEQSILKALMLKINKLTTGIDRVVEKYEADRPKLLLLIEDLKQKAGAHE